MPNTVMIASDLTHISTPVPRDSKNYSVIYVEARLTKPFDSDPASGATLRFTGHGGRALPSTEPFTKLEGAASELIIKYRELLRDQYKDPKRWPEAELHMRDLVHSYLIEQTPAMALSTFVALRTIQDQYALGDKTARGNRMIQYHPHPIKATISLNKDGRGSGSSGSTLQDHPIPSFDNRLSRHP